MAAAKVREMFEKGTDAFNRHDIEAMGELLTDDVRVRSPGAGEVKGKQSVKAFYKSWVDAFPDARVEIKAVTCTDDMAIEEGVFTGTQRNALHGPGGDIPPTGRNVRVDYIQVARYRGDKVSAFNLIFDRLEMLEQLGVMPSQEEGASRRPGERSGEGAGMPH
jgi:steroid delta-isomerase-like uncharacterized protein